MTLADITAEHFPTPDLALRGGSDWNLVRAFADIQAQAATSLYATLRDITPPNPSVQYRMTALGIAYRDAAYWRYNLARRGTILGGTATAGADHTRFRTPITDDTPNLDAIGVVARFRHGAAWDADARTFVGGVDTPASVVCERYGRAALARFAMEAPDADVLTNRVTLPSGAVIEGNSLLRGDTARSETEGMVRRMAARGVDTSRVDIGGDLIYTRTAPERSRDRFREAALSTLAADGVGPDAFNRAAYYLYQGPQFKKGSDAVHRVFLVAASAWLLGRALPVSQDVDLACMVLGWGADLTPPLVMPG